MNNYEDNHIGKDVGDFNSIDKEIRRQKKKKQISRCNCSRLYGPQGNNEQIRIDEELREKEEKSLGIKFTDREWFMYKLKLLTKNEKETNS
jgi:hypothetical protein